MKNIHIIPTDKPSRLVKFFTNKYHLCKEILPIQDEEQYQQSYITNDEEIKDCWVLNTHTNQVYFLKGFYGIQPITKKIILTTDPSLAPDVQKIDDEFLQWFVKNPSCEEVDVEKIGFYKPVKNEETDIPEFDCYEYKIIIPKEEPKQETMKNIHILTTSKPSRLRIGNNGNFVIGLAQNAIVSKNDSFTNQNIYITNSEEIKEERCWVINSMDKIESVPHSKWGKLIIMTTDQDLIKDGVKEIDDDFLEWFVKNPSCEEVELVSSLLRVNSFDWKTDYKIIIPKEEPKQEPCDNCNNDVCCCIIRTQETLEEAAEIEKIAMDKLKSKWEHLYTFGYPQKPFPTNYENDLNNVKVGLYEGAKWQQQNSYSEEEAGELVYNIMGEYAKHYGIMIDGTKLNELFEQFKKK